MKQKQTNPTPTPIITPAPAPVETVPVPQKQTTEPDRVGDSGMTWLWRVSGGVLLLAATLVCVAVHQSMDRQIDQLRKQLAELNQELRRDLGRLSESHGSMIRKEDHNTKLRTVWDKLREIGGDHTALARVHERCAVLQEMYRGNEEDRKQMSEEIRKLREGQSADTDRQALLREIRALRERIAQLESKPTVVPTMHLEPTGQR